MRQSRDAKAETHRAIIDAASGLFRKSGIERTSVADVMQSAAKTHGGFYRHFESKEALLATALEAAFIDMAANIETGLDRIAPSDVLAAFAGFYLAPAQVENVAGGCPAAALAGEIARGNTDSRRGFANGVELIIDRIAAKLAGPPAERRHRGAQAFAMAVGALTIARASDPETAASVLDAARQGIAII